MTDHELLELAKSEGFIPVMTSPEQIPINAKFRVYCEENLCGRYNANYSCPPDCGTVEELQRRILAEDQVMVIQTLWDIAGYDDKDTILHAKKSHNAAALRLMEKIRKKGYSGFCSGYNGCALCTPCKRIANQPCTYPDLRISCMSAYCVDVAELASRCNLTFEWSPQRLHLFGMVAFHKNKNIIK